MPACGEKDFTVRAACGPISSRNAVRSSPNSARNSMGSKMSSIKYCAVAARRSTANAGGVRISSD